jgi:EAL domain-containing protein (putative c-di-GMP-specific phosphodiesterase class I)
MRCWRLGCECFQGNLFAPPLPPMAADEIFRPRLPNGAQA